MIVNPGIALLMGYVESVHDDVPIDRENQLSANGIDIRIDTVSIMKGKAFIGIDDRKLLTYDQLDVDQDGFYHFQAGCVYAIEMMEKCNVANDNIALVMQRSSLNRSGTFITGSIYDSGYNGVIGATLRPSCDIAIQRGARVAQIIFMTASAYKAYDGVYKGEKSHVESKGRVDNG